MRRSATAGASEQPVLQVEQRFQHAVDKCFRTALARELHIGAGGPPTLPVRSGFGVTRSAFARWPSCVPLQTCSSGSVFGPQKYNMTLFEIPVLGMLCLALASLRAIPQR